MTQRLDTQEEVKKTINTSRCIVFTLWFFSMCFIGAVIKNEAIAAFMTLGITFFCIYGFYKNKKILEERIKTPPVSQGVNPIVVSTAVPTEQPQVLSSKMFNEWPNINTTVQTQNKPSALHVTDSINVPKCPTCQSANVEKISFASKAGKVALVGILAIGQVSKTFKCNSCGYKW